ncbi:MAG: hypothetical protein ACRDPC_28225 [Solirubrobacteraceae bacterium]
MSDPLDELVDRAETAELLAAANEHFAAQHGEHQAEVEAWDHVAGDGLTDASPRDSYRLRRPT